ncbi:hypothetical protein RO3G_16674 [Rhizopus delemar RA 99-880]|uniref:Uncharacterized protein n=3 Tax=Rhizopus TaxID=4842 RepID=I1CU33_RHIO9|nr:hypothetical protein RO3G_16674 [Rhizopus delemar RA 99-880]|eukprot:EIE91963.1 hypothetical protein RO3G_16674 [Rhizopus delemar RA 99-880]
MVAWYDNLYKLILTGVSGVGKSNAMSRFATIILSKCQFGISLQKKNSGLSFQHITSRFSFENARCYWLHEIRKSADPNAVIMLVGNKVDLGESSREVKTEEGRSLAEEEGLLFIETSALDATNIDAAFTILISKICSNFSTKTQGCPESTDN